MEKKIEGKMKSVASIPANYVSILQLQERWTKEQERKQKEKDLEERGVKQQVNGQGRREEEEEEEEDVIKVTETTQSREKLEDRWKKEAKCVEKEKIEVSANKEENGGGGGDSRKRKKKRSKKKENKKQGGSVEKIVECESNVYIRWENNNNNQGDRIVQNRENAASDSIAVETQFQDLRIKKRDQEEEKEVKRPARQGGYYRNQKHDWSSSARVIRAKGSGAMVWVKKRNNDGAASENGV